MSRPLRPTSRRGRALALVVAVSLGFGVPGVATGQAPAKEGDPCDDAASTLQLQQCLSRSGTDTEREVAAATKRLRSLVVGRQPRSAGRVDADAKRWADFVQARCALAGAAVAVGSAQPVVVANCRQSMAQRRAADLAGLIEDWSR